LDEVAGICPSILSNVANVVKVCADAAIAVAAQNTLTIRVIFEKLIFLIQPPLRLQAGVREFKPSTLELYD
jgi:hypothetical protein